MQRLTRHFWNLASGNRANEALIFSQCPRSVGERLLATSEELPGLIAQGRTIAETVEITQDVARKLIESYIEHGDPLPPKLHSVLKRKPQRVSLKIPVGVASEAIAE